MSRIPAAIRTKNPGAMWPGPIPTKWGSVEWIYLNDGTGQGGDGHGNKIAIFPDFVHGAAAQFDLWRTSRNYRGQPLAQAIKIWSGGNSWGDYVAWLIAKVPGLTRATVIDDNFLASTMGLNFMRYQAWHEAGQPMPMTDDEWLEAQSLVFLGNPTVADKDIMPLIRIGDAGSAVSEMQIALGVTVTARYTARSETEYALRLYQVRHGLEPDGICGPRTWDKLHPPVWAKP